MELSQHLKPQPSDSPSRHSSSVVHGGGKLWNSGSGTDLAWSVLLLVCCALPLRVHMWPRVMAVLLVAHGCGTSRLHQLPVAELGVLGTARRDWK